MSKTAKSASYPSAMRPLGMPNSAPGLYDAMRTASAIRTVPERTISMTIGMVVSTPGMPDGAASNSCCFSSAVCGAWSVPIMSNCPSANLVNSSSLVAMSRIGGLTLYSVPGKRSTSNRRWCRVTSVVNPAALARSSPRGVVRWHMLMSAPLKRAARREIADHSASAGRLRRWSLQHRSSSLEIRSLSSAWTLRRLPVASASRTVGTSSSSSFMRMFPVVDPMNSLNPTTRGASIPALIPAVTAANNP